MHEFGVDLMSPGGWLPLAFALVMALSMLAYVILDGYDLGVGALLDSADSVEQKDIMIASIGPFWDANETWLVLGVGVLLVGFPMAHGVILGALYLPVALMLVALSLRGVAFDFRVKAKAQHRPLWDKTFYIGSLLASFIQISTGLTQITTSDKVKTPYTLTLPKRCRWLGKSSKCTNVKSLYA